MKIRAAIIFGGASSEYEVSLISASSVIKNMPEDKYEVIMLGITKEGKWFLYEGPYEDLPNNKWLNSGKITPAIISPDSSRKGIVVFEDDAYRLLPVDVAFPVIHGKNGEDGSIQGLLELAGIPYVGCGVTSSAVCMDKALANTISENAGIKHAKWKSVTEFDYNKDMDGFISEAVAYLGYPIFVKPACAGSSIGISKAGNDEELREAMTLAFKYDSKAALEEAIDGYEVECAVLGNEEPVASIVGEIAPKAGFYDYQSKYIDDSAELLIPATISEEKSEEVRETAIKAYRALGCSGLSRVDFFVRKDDGTVLLNEVNTIPGFTSISMYPKLFERGGMPYSDLLDKLFALALEKDGSRLEIDWAGSL